uniref:Uncharacterized protein n=1 Tax=Rhizophora mucronata TaxID=61149 RepID=A0A2P2R3R0_RHIMU
MLKCPQLETKSAGSTQNQKLKTNTKCTKSHSG